MQGTITSRFWPPLPRLRVTLERFWMIGDHGFWVARLRERHEWVGPWYGTRRDYEAIGWSVAGDVPTQIDLGHGIQHEF